MAKHSKNIPARGLRVADQIQRDLAEILASGFKRSESASNLDPGLRRDDGSDFGG